MDDADTRPHWSPRLARLLSSSTGYGRQPRLQRRGREYGGGKPVPTDTDYASVIESDVPIVVQHSRLDSRQAENALLSSTAYAASSD